MIDIFSTLREKAVPERGELSGKAFSSVLRFTPEQPTITLIKRRVNLERIDLPTFNIMETTYAVKYRKQTKTELMIHKMKSMFRENKVLD